MSGITAPDPSGQPSGAWVIWVTCSQDQREHAVADDEIAVSFLERSGTYRSLCGHTIVPQSMAEPFGPRCARCHTLREQRRTAARSAASTARRLARRLLRSAP
ncbi:MAG: hypothetical protein J2P20_08515 [Pseudonocardia sp.]|nr:hypothetical protein [Pseudonocardia sp.]